MPWLSLLSLACCLWLADSQPRHLFVSPQCVLPHAQRVDCYPQDWDGDVEACVARGCCFQPPIPSLTQNWPRCYFPTDYGYTVSDMVDTPVGFSGILTLSGPNRSAPYGEDIKRLLVEVRLETSNRVRIRIIDANATRYEVPLAVPPVTRKATKTEYHITYTTSPFGVAVVRTATEVAIFNTSFGALIFRPQFLQISTLLPSPNIYGLGERWGRFRLDLEWEKVVMFASNSGPRTESRRHLGVHPFYLGVENDGSAHGVLFLNSNAMEVVAQPTPGLTFRTIGGIIDFYVFLGPTVDNVVSQYTAVVGRPQMPPYWALGFHLSRQGYASADHVQSVVELLRKSGVPQDGQWFDVDYMARHLDFTFNKGNWKGLPHLVSNLHFHSQRAVLAVDPVISPSVTEGFYPAYDRGVEQDIFIKKRPNELLIGKANPGKVVYPDFFHPETSGWWAQLLNEFHHQVLYDGVWLKANEPFNEVDGAVDGCPQNQNWWDYPPYVPEVAHGKLNAQTICMAARHFGNRLHYDLHSLYGFAQQKATCTALTQQWRHRPLVMSSSTYPGSGRYGGHWMGDVSPNYTDMAATISGILAFSLFGIPLAGADICGFPDTSDEELCGRWYQLGAFYPFARNHIQAGWAEEDPGPAQYSPGLLMAMKESLLTRYHLLPYLYTLFWEAHAFGFPVARALFYDAPTDPLALTMESQFLWGKALMISPALAGGKSTVDVYFPEGLWYDFYSGATVPKIMIDSQERGRTLTLPASPTKINLHLRGGTVVPLQSPSITTAFSRANRLELLVGLSEEGTASGTLFWDDGLQVNSYAAGKYFLFQFTARPGTIEMDIQHHFHNKEALPLLDEIRIFGVENAVNVVNLKRQAGWWPSVKRLRAFAYSSSYKVLHIQQLRLEINRPWKITYSM